VYVFLNDCVHNNKRILVTCILTEASSIATWEELLINREVKAKANLERKCCTDGHENDDLTLQRLKC